MVEVVRFNYEEDVDRFYDESPPTFVFSDEIMFFSGPKSKVFVLKGLTNFTTYQGI